MAEIPDFWSVSEEGLESADQGLQNRYGMLAAIPMICKVHACPFAEVCHIPKDQLKKGQRCPIEVATVMDRYERYIKHLDVDDENVVDLSLVRELVDIEIQMMRADMKLAIDADFVEMVVASVDPNGQPYYKPELNKAVDYKDRLRRERHRILDLLASTRKNVGSQNSNDPSTLAAILLKKAAERAQEKGE